MKLIDMLKKYLDIRKRTVLYSCETKEESISFYIEHHAVSNTGRQCLCRKLFFRKY